MADEDVATKAPESDQHAETSSQDTTTSPNPPITPSFVSTQDTPAQNDATMDHCTTDRPTPSHLGSPTGELTDLNGISCYVSKPAEYPHNPGKLLLLLSSGTGIKSTNNQLQADAYAKRGFLVIMPDQFNGDPAPNATSPPAGPVSPSEDSSILERLKMGVVETSKAFMVDMWLARHTPEKVLPIIRKALEGAKEQFADAVANGDGVYGAGYCFGAKYILLLLGSHPNGVLYGHKSPGADLESGEVMLGPELKVGAIAHGTMVTKEDLEAIRRPVSLVCVTNDVLFPDEVREQGKAALELEGVEHEIKVFDACPHGFAVVGDYGDANLVEKQQEAFEVMCAWLDRH